MGGAPRASGSGARQPTSRPRQPAWAGSGDYVQGHRHRGAAPPHTRPAPAAAQPESRPTAPRQPDAATLPGGPQRPRAQSPPTPRPRPAARGAVDQGPADAITATLAWEQPIHGADPPGAALALRYCADATAAALAAHLSCPYGCTERHRHFACVTIRVTASDQVGRGSDRLAALGLCAGGCITALCVPWPCA